MAAILGLCQGMPGLMHSVHKVTGSRGEIPEVKVQGKLSRSQKAKCEMEEGNHSISSSGVVTITIILIGAVVVVVSYYQLFLSFSCCTILDNFLTIELSLFLCWYPALMCPSLPCA